MKRHLCLLCGPTYDETCTNTRDGEHRLVLEDEKKLSDLTTVTRSVSDALINMELAGWTTFETDHRSPGTVIVGLTRPGKGSTECTCADPESEEIDADCTFCQYGAPEAEYLDITVSIALGGPLGKS